MQGSKGNSIATSITAADPPPVPMRLRLCLCCQDLGQQDLGQLYSTSQDQYQTKTKTRRSNTNSALPIAYVLVIVLFIAATATASGSLVDLQYKKAHACIDSCFLSSVM